MASMRQLEIDLSKPGFSREEEVDYEAAKESIEQRYPQVCEDCQPGVLEGIKASLRWARTNDVGRRMNRTRDSVGKHSSRYALSDLGLFLWHAGLWGHVSWCTSSVLRGARFDRFVPVGIPLFTKLPSYLQTLIKITTSNSWILLSLACTLASCWWHPYIRKSSRVYRDNINGLQNWYKFQIFIVAIRFVAWRLMGTGVTADSSRQATICAHLILVVINLLVRYHNILYVLSLTIR